MSATPLLDAYVAWRAGGRTGPIPWPRPCADWGRLTPARRYAAIIAACASGAPAILPRRRRRVAVIDTRTGRVLPPPPTRSTITRKQP